MASSPVFTKLGDIRQKYSDDELTQNYALRNQFPLPLTGAQSREGNSLTAAIVMARHLLSQISIPFRKINDENLFASMIWADLDDPDSLDEQKQARLAMLDKFRERYPDQPIKFFSLMENQGMWDTFWSLPALQLFHHSVAAGGMDPGKWKVAKIGNKDDLPRMSLVKYDGKGELGVCVSDNFGTFNFDNIVQHWQCNIPAIIRVHYQHDSADDYAKEWDDLREIHIRPHRLRETEKNGVKSLYVDSDGGDPISYILIAVARLGNDLGQPDHIRLYRKDGDASELPLHTVAYANTDWKLGQAHDAYMLYYTKKPPGFNSGEPREEVRVRQPHIARLYKQARLGVQLRTDDRSSQRTTSTAPASTSSQRDLPPNVPRGPRAMETRGRGQGSFGNRSGGSSQGSVSRGYDTNRDDRGGSRGGSRGGGRGAGRGAGRGGIRGGHQRDHQGGHQGGRQDSQRPMD